MYVGHYKAVKSNNEFYSSKRETLDFPTQVEIKGERYLLHNTYAVPSSSILKSLYERAEDLGIPKDIKID